VSSLPSGTEPASSDAGAVRSMLEPRTIAVVGASPRPGSFGERMATEVARSAATVHFVNPRYDEIGGRPCHASLDQLPEPVDLVLLGVGDASLEAELKRAAVRGDRSAVIFGNAYEPVVAGVPALRERLTSIAQDAGMALCGGGCMGFVNVVRDIRAIGYVEPDPLPAGPVALVTHSGSVFSAMLRARRGIGYTVAVSSGQELVTTTAGYLDYALSVPQTEVLGLVVETMRDAGALRASLAVAAARDVPVVVLPVGTSERGASMVAAHSGAIAGGTAAWEALADAYGLHLVGDLGELLDTVELFAAGRRARVAPAAVRRPAGLGAVLDSGAERALLVDVAEAAGAAFAGLSADTIAALSARLDPGLVATNPLDVWGNGADTEGLFGDVLVALAADPAVRALALAVDLVTELDGDTSYLRAVERAAASTDLPVVVLSHMPSALDPDGARTLRAAGIPVLEGTRSGLLALRHLLDHADRRPSEVTPSPELQAGRARRDRWRSRIAAGDTLPTVQALQLLADYGIVSAATRAADDEDALLAAAGEIGYPVVLKTDEAIAHKTDVGGVVVGIGNRAELSAAYRAIAERLGSRAVVCEQVADGTELMLGAVRDPNLGMMLVVGAGGILVEQLSDRVAALPPVDASHAQRLLGRAVVGRLLSSPRHGPPADLDAIAAAITAFSRLVADLGDVLEAVEVNPLICSASGAVAVDVHLEPRAHS
jgi:acyl-CoA synthetase (NDP forming)